MTTNNVVFITGATSGFGKQRHRCLPKRAGRWC
jgi:NADP-dependent 3-hydroxy acid dehydrogenase YdfG